MQGRASGRAIIDHAQRPDNEHARRHERLEERAASTLLANGNTRWPQSVRHAEGIPARFRRRPASYYSLPALEQAGIGKVSRLPVSIRIVLESVLRNCDGKKVTEEHVRQLANWKPTAPRTDEIPFVVARVVLQDFTGVPLLVRPRRDAQRRRATSAKNPKMIEPLVPVDLVVDHSVQIDYYGAPDALDLNMKLEFKRNDERYQFMKWGMQAFDTFKVVPPGIGIVHQVNLEYLAPRRASRRTASTTPTRSSAPTATRR